ncbi:MAG: hypothetical protein BJG00_004615 [Limnothrix sp. CACIAM 69d]|nr:MAG: hypothetical protein BJG00_004615 [Limnothrix sp. CACIAM 69d]
MANREGFGSGFFWGALLGGAVGGLVGAALASRNSDEGLEELTEKGDREGAELPPRPRRRPRLAASESSEARMETARQGLEDKIAQLNDAIDDVRRQLGSRNGRPGPDGREKPLKPEES